MGDVFNQGIHQMLSPGVCIMTLKPNYHNNELLDAQVNKMLHVTKPSSLLNTVKYDKVFDFH